MKTGGRLVKRVRFFWRLPAEGDLKRSLIGGRLRMIAALPLPVEAQSMQALMEGAKREGKLAVAVAGAWRYLGSDELPNLIASHLDKPETPQQWSGREVMERGLPVTLREQRSSGLSTYRRLPKTK